MQRSTAAGIACAIGLAIVALVMVKATRPAGPRPQVEVGDAMRELENITRDVFAESCAVVLERSRPSAAEPSVSITLLRQSEDRLDELRYSGILLSPGVDLRIQQALNEPVIDSEKLAELLSLVLDELYAMHDAPVPVILIEAFQGNATIHRRGAGVEFIEMSLPTHDAVARYGLAGRMWVSDATSRQFNDSKLTGGPVADRVDRNVVTLQGFTAAAGGGENVFRTRVVIDDHYRLWRREFEVILPNGDKQSQVTLDFDSHVLSPSGKWYPRRWRDNRLTRSRERIEEASGDALLLVAPVGGAFDKAIGIELRRASKTVDGGSSGSR